MMKIKWIVIAFSAALISAPTYSFARHGADDPLGHEAAEHAAGHEAAEHATGHEANEHASNAGNTSNSSANSNRQNRGNEKHGRIRRGRDDTLPLPSSAP